MLADSNWTYLINGGNVKYYFWNEMSDAVHEVQESNLDNILDALKFHEYSGLKLKYLGQVMYDPWEIDPNFIMEECEVRGKTLAKPLQRNTGDKVSKQEEKSISSPAT